MKVKMILIVFLSLAVAPATLSAGLTSDEGIVIAHPIHTSAAALENLALTDLPPLLPRGLRDTHMTHFLHSLRIES